MRLLRWDKARIGGVVLAGLLAMAAYDARWGPPACDSQAWYCPIKPKIMFGISVGFKSWVESAFPIGSCAADLMAWMDRLKFGATTIGYAEAEFLDCEESSRSYARQDADQKISRRTLQVSAPIGDSFFTIAWNADSAGLITEIFSDTELLHFDMP